jgi:hypothetical protein
MEAPILGEHNEAVLGQYLGRSPESLTALYGQGILYKGEK